MSAPGRTPTVVFFPCDLQSPVPLSHDFLSAKAKHVAVVGMLFDEVIDVNSTCIKQLPRGRLIHTFLSIPSASRSVLGKAMCQRLQEVRRAGTQHMPRLRTGTQVLDLHVSPSCSQLSCQGQATSCSIPGSICFRKHVNQCLLLLLGMATSSPYFCRIPVSQELDYSVYHQIV